MGGVRTREAVLKHPSPAAVARTARWSPTVGHGMFCLNSDKLLGCIYLDLHTYFTAVGYYVQRPLTQPGKGASLAPSSWFRWFLAKNPTSECLRRHPKARGVGGRAPRLQASHLQMETSQFVCSGSYQVRTDVRCCSVRCCEPPSNFELSAAQRLIYALGAFLLKYPQRPRPSTYRW